MHSSWLSNFTPGIYARRMHAYSPQEAYEIIFIAALFRVTPNCAFQSQTSRSQKKKEIIVKGVIFKKITLTWGTTIKLTTKFSTEIMKIQTQWNIFNLMNENNYQCWILCTMKVFFKNEGKYIFQTNKSRERNWK